MKKPNLITLKRIMKKPLANPYTWIILSVALIAATAGATRQSPPLSELPVVNMVLVDPMKYKEAEDAAAKGGAPLDIVLNIVGEFEGATQHIIQVNEGVEAPSVSRITVLRDGLMDDAVKGVRWDIVLEKTPGVWSIKEVKQAWRCWRGGQQDRFAAVPCP
jgi:hypothetical protein